MALLGVTREWMPFSFEVKIRFSPKLGINKQSFKSKTNPESRKRIDI